jgi:hypothetical protein
MRPLTDPAPAKPVRVNVIMSLALKRTDGRTLCLHESAANQGSAAGQPVNIEQVPAEKADIRWSAQGVSRACRSTDGISSPDHARRNPKAEKHGATHGVAPMMYVCGPLSAPADRVAPECERRAALSPYHSPSAMVCGRRSCSTGHGPSSRRLDRRCGRPSPWQRSSAGTGCAA